MVARTQSSLSPISLKGKSMAVDRAAVAKTLADLLHQTSEDHHIAFKETDGVDPDWSIWYAGRLLEKGIEKMLDATLLKSDLIYLLVGADKEINRTAPGAKWEAWYADYLITRYLR
jgi:hypothetical protein